MDVAFIAHGLLGDQLASERTYAEAEPVIRTNFLSVVALLIPLANHLESAGRGTIGVMSSVAGERGRPRNYTYGAAKGALNVYLQGLRTRLRRQRRPGAHVEARPRRHADDRRPPQDAGVRARARRRRRDRDADRRGRGEAYLPWFWRPIMSVVRHAPEPALRRIPFLAGR